jgi:hypothetical protein
MLYETYETAMRRKEKTEDSAKPFVIDRHWVINQIAEEINPQVRGWHNYYTKFGKSAFWYVMKHLNDKLARWARRKYKDFKKHPKHAKVWLESLSRRERGMFVHWSLGYVPQAAK